MKKLALTALAALVTLTGLAATASADSRYNDEDQWRRHSQRDGGDRDGGDWDGRRDGDRHADRGRDRDRDEWRWRDRRDHWRYRHNPRYVFRYDRADYCFVKKVRRYDDWGNVYIKRVRICR